MKNFTAEYFFDFQHYRHRQLFEGCLYVWQALPKIAPYLKSYSFGGIKGSIEVEVPKGVYLINPETISIGKGSVLEPGAYIKGPCILGENCTVRHGAYIRGDFIAGDGCVIGHDTEIKNSLFFDNVHAAHFAYVGDSILGSHVNLGAGTKCANLKFDYSNIIVTVEGKKIDTGLHKFGAIMGDLSQTGCNSVTNPGTLFGQRVFCYPCMNVGGFIPSDHIVKPSEHPIIVPYHTK